MVDVELGAAGEERLADLPEVPTFEERGIRDFDPTGYVAVSATAGTPREIIARLNREIVRGVGTPEVRGLFQRLRMQPVTTSPEQFARMMTDDIERWGPLIRSLGITLD